MVYRKGIGKVVYFVIKSGEQEKDSCLLIFGMRKISCVTREGRSWKISVTTKKPEDGRYKTTESLWLC